MMRMRMSDSMDLKKAIFYYINDYYNEHGYNPSFDEIASEMAISKSTVHKYVKMMFDDGVIETDLDYIGARAYRIVKKY